MFPRFCAYRTPRGVGVGVVDDDDDDDVLAAYFDVTSSRNRRTWGDVILDGGKCKRPEEQG
jgi:hypothetical protein